MKLRRHIGISILSCWVISIAYAIPGREQQLPGLFFHEVEYRGEIVDSTNNQPLPSAVLSVISSLRGEMFVKSHIADSKGRFLFKGPAHMQSRVEISCLGYKVYTQTLPADNPECNLGRIRLSPDPQQIDEVVVKARMQMYRINGDTIIYLPSAVKTMEGESALAILKQMPGVEVSDKGAVKILNELVERTYVNGHLIFGEDPATALKKIDAADVSAIQAYDEPDEKREMTYGKNARKRKALNVVTFAKFSESLTGSLRLEGGLDAKKEEPDGGRHKRYLAAAEGGYYSERTQFSVEGSIDNRNTPIPGLDKPEGNTAKSSADVKWSGRSQDNVHKYNFGYAFRHSDADQSDRSQTDYFPTDDFQNQLMTDSSSMDRVANSHNLNASYGYKKSDFLLNLSVISSIDKSTLSSWSATKTLRDEAMIASLGRWSRVKEKKWSFFSDMSGVKKFGSGNSLTFKIGVDASDTKKDERREDRSLFTGSPASNVLLGIDHDSPDAAVEFASSYNINTNRAGTFSLYGEFNYRNRGKYALALDEATGERDLSLSGDNTTNEKRFEAGLRYTYENKKHVLGVKIPCSWLFLHHREKIPAEGRIRKTYTAFIPYFNYAYKPVAGAMYAAMFTAMQNAPAVEYCRSWINADNPMFLFAGNPSLKPDTRYFLRLLAAKMKNQRSLEAFADLDLSHGGVVQLRRYFAETTVLDDYGGYEVPAGATLTTFANGGNSIQLKGGVIYKTRVPFLRGIVRLAGSYAYRNPQAGVDERLVRTHGHDWEANLSYTTNFSSKFRLEVASNTVYNLFKNSDNCINRGIRETAGARLRWDFLDRAFFTASYSMDYFHNDVGIEPVDDHILNASIGCFLFKNRQGKMSFNAYDILDRTTSLETSITNQYAQNSWKKLYSSYYTLAFEYRFNNSR